MTPTEPNQPARPDPSPAGPPPDVRAIVSRLGRLRTRIRGIFTTIAMGRWIVAAIGLLAVFFLADWLLDLPLAVRQFVRLGLLQPPAGLSLGIWLPLLLVSLVLLVALTRRNHGAAPLFAFIVGGIVGLLAWLAVRLFRPTRVALSDEELALSVESRYDELNDRLAGALDFEQELRDPSRGESAPMMRAVVQEAADAVRALRFDRAVSGRRALRWAGFALLAALGASVLGVAFPDTTGLWARRSLLLEDEAWPRDTHMIAVDLRPDGGFDDHPAGTPYDVPIGRSFTVYARAVGDVPDDAQVLDLIDGQDPLARRMFGVPGHENVFAYEFLDVRRPFSFILRGGDDDDDIPRYEVEITIPPRILSISSEITFPAYLGRPVQQVADGSVTVPQGSQVEVTFTTDMDIAEAQALLGDKVLACAPVGSDADAARTFKFAYVAERSERGRIVMKTPEGKPNDPAADGFDVRVKTDRPPRVEWTFPHAGVEAAPAGRVPLLVRATDDHGVAGLVLEVRVNTEEDWRRFELEPFSEDADTDGRQVPQSATDGPFGRRRVLAYLPIEIAQVKTADGQPLLASSEVSFRIEARDSRDQIRQSELARVAVLNAGNLEQTLASRRRNVRMALESVRRQQEARRGDIASVVGQPIGRPELDLLKTVRFAQGKIAQDTDRAVQDLISVFNGFVYDRLGSPMPNQKILDILDRYHRTTYGLEPSPNQEPPLQPAGDKGAWKGDPVFPYALYGEVVEAWRSKVIFDKGLLNKMLAALADALEVGSKLAPAAHRAATAATSGEAARIDELLAAQDANLDMLGRLLEAMSGWQSLSDMTVKLRKIIEKQEQLLKQMDAESSDTNGAKK